MRDESRVASRIELATILSIRVPLEWMQSAVFSNPKSRVQNSIVSLLHKEGVS